VVRWFVLGALLVSLLVLAVAVRRVLTRLSGLLRAAQALQERQEHANQLRDAALTLQRRGEELQERIETVQRRIGVIRGRRAARLPAAQPVRWASPTDGDRPG
jgi:hypothetical protein